MASPITHKHIRPFFDTTAHTAATVAAVATVPPAESPPHAALIATLGMLPHIEGGYFVETDRDPRLVASPFPPDADADGDAAASWAQTTVQQLVGGQRPGFEDPSRRNASTSILYLLTPGSPQGHFHRNRARTVHTLHKGRGRYVLLHLDDGGGSGSGSGSSRGGEEEERQGRQGHLVTRVETFVVGQDVGRGERLQWIVEGNVYKASFLLPDAEGGTGSAEGLLISETVVPGFEYCDHDFLTRDGLGRLLGEAKAKELEWLVRTG